nr:EOG090X08S2 [Eulimnadia texana]
MAKGNAKLIELRPQKSLLDPTFEGYKLSLDQLPIYKHEIPATVEHLKPSEEQYSYQHIRTFGLHNHLTTDLWNPNLCYFVTKDHQIYEVHLSSLASQHPEFVLVWEPSAQSLKVAGNYNAALSFPSPNIAVFSDGAGTLFILSTGNVRPVPRIPGSASTLQKNSLKKGKMGSRKGKIKKRENDNMDEPTEPLHLHVLLLRVEMLGNPHGFEYASVLSRGSSVCIAAREPIGLIYDSQKKTPDSMEVDMKVEDKPDYLWTETSDEVTLWFRLDAEAKKDNVQVNIIAKDIQVVFKDKVLLQGELSHPVSKELTTWFLSDGKLEIILSKVDKNTIWGHVVPGNSKGQPHVCFDHIKKFHAPETVGQRGSVFSNQQLEECDAFPEDELSLMRLDGESHVVTHKASLGSHQVLFTTGLAPNLAPALCLRHDVDGLVWQPLGDEHLAGWSCNHVGTFQALGYVQASKEQRKFTVCPQDYSYAAICDALRHIYVYRQPGPMPSGVQLTHRPTGRKIGSLAIQQLVSLDIAEEILGAVATNKLLLIVTSTTLFAIKINSD